MKIHVLLFGPVRLMVGKPELVLDLQDGAIVRDAMDRLAQDHPELREAAACLRYAVDSEYAEPVTLLQEGQTLALIPPVQGG